MSVGKMGKLRKAVTGITLEEEQLETLDDMAREYNTSRSRILRAFCRLGMETLEEMEAIDFTDYLRE